MYRSSPDPAAKGGEFKWPAEPEPGVRNLKHTGVWIQTQTRTQFGSGEGVYLDGNDVSTINIYYDSEK